jgi:hypothetical protein
MAIPSVFREITLQFARRIQGNYGETDFVTRRSARPSACIPGTGHQGNGIHLAPFEQGEIGPDLFRATCDMMLEGLVSKRRDSRYRPRLCCVFTSRREKPVRPQSRRTGRLFAKVAYEANCASSTARVLSRFSLRVLSALATIEYSGSAGSETPVWVSSSAISTLRMSTTRRMSAMSWRGCNAWTVGCFILAILELNRHTKPAPRSRYSSESKCLASSALLRRCGTHNR